MSTSSPRELSSGKCLISNSSGTENSIPSNKINTDMKNNVILTNEHAQVRPDSPIHGFVSQQDNEERFNHLQNEMSAIKAIMVRLIQQNEDKQDKQDKRRDKQTPPLQLHHLP